MSNLKPKIISKIAAYGNQRWRINPDGSYSVLAFGTTGPNQTPHWTWMYISGEKVPLEVKETLE